jgi:hypothetical protein
MGQQENGMLPKQLTPTDMQILKDSLMDDIFDFEYNVKEDISEAQGSIDETDVEDEVIKNVEESIITEDSPVDTIVKTQKQIDLEKKQKERKDKLDNILNKATQTVDTAQKFMEESKSKTYKEKRDIAKEREEKTIKWFKNLFTGE